MAVSVPGSKEQVTLLTATWPPKRMVSLSVVSMDEKEARAWRQAAQAFQVKAASSAAGQAPSAGRKDGGARHIAGRSVSARCAWERSFPQA
jgi:hypothetical protein